VIRSVGPVLSLTEDTGVNLLTLAQVVRAIFNRGAKACFAVCCDGNERNGAGVHLQNTKASRINHSSAEQVKETCWRPACGQRCVHVLTAKFLRGQ